jgi:predicted TIM-barrel enzyme
MEGSRKSRTDRIILSGSHTGTLLALVKKDGFSRTERALVLYSNTGLPAMRMVGWMDGWVIDGWMKNMREIENGHSISRHVLWRCATTYIWRSPCYPHSQLRWAIALCH